MKLKDFQLNMRIYSHIIKYVHINPEKKINTK